MWVCGNQSTMGWLIYVWLKIRWVLPIDFFFLPGNLYNTSKSTSAFLLAINFWGFHFCWEISFDLKKTSINFQVPMLVFETQNIVDHQKGRRQDLTRWSVVILKQLGQMITNGTNRKPLEIDYSKYVEVTGATKKEKNSDFPLYWLFNRDPYHGLLQSSTT